MIKNHQKWVQNGVRAVPEGPKRPGYSLQNRPKMAPKPLKTGPKRLQNPPKTPQNAKKHVSGGSPALFLAKKASKTGLETLRDPVFGRKNGPRRVSTGLKTSKNTVFGHFLASSHQFWGHFQKLKHFRASLSNRWFCWRKPLFFFCTEGGRPFWPQKRLKMSPKPLKSTQNGLKCKKRPKVHQNLHQNL